MTQVQNVFFSHDQKILRGIKNKHNETQVVLILKTLIMIQTNINKQKKIQSLSIYKTK